MEYITKETIIVFWMIFGLYLLVLCAIFADLVSGIRKAKKRGEARTSYGLKRTVDKLARYYNGLFALTVIDLMQMIGIWYLDGYYGYKIPLIPIITGIGAVCIGLIEVKSIYEKAEDKVKNQSQEVMEMLAYIAGHKGSPDDIAKKVVEYLNTNREGGA
ncbi:MAG: hypothetical protein ACI30I_09015 [Parabacteroides sp.]